MSVELWLVRHGETDWNVEGKIQGHTDIPLNEVGFGQAHKLANEIKQIQFDAVFSSDLKRAHQTAIVLAESIGLSVLIDSRLCEINRGVWEGELLKDIREKFADHILHLKEDPLHYAVPGGEASVEVATRMCDAADEIAAKYQHGRVLVVSHGYALATLIASIKGISIDNARKLIPGNASPVVIQWTEGKYSVE